MTKTMASEQIKKQKDYLIFIALIFLRLSKNTYLLIKANVLVINFLQWHKNCDNFSVVPSIINENEKMCRSIVNKILQICVKSKVI
jgi:hypothetical protein